MDYAQVSSLGMIVPVAPAVDVVIPTLDAGPRLLACLRSLAGTPMSHRIIVVHDGPGSGVLPMPEGAELIATGARRGFAAAVNAGISAGNAPHVVVLNDDVECDTGFLEQIVRPFRRADVGMVAALVLRPGRVEIDSYGLEVDPTLVGFPRLAGLPAAGTHLHDGHLLGPTGAAGAYARAALEQVGGFDERIFGYSEDLDLALRIRAAGFGASGSPRAVAVHLGGATFGVRSRLQRQAAGASRGLLMRKYGVLRGARATAGRALLTEVGVVAAQTIRHRDVVAATSRIRGWRSGTDACLTPPEHALNTDLSFRAGVRRRLGTGWRVM